MTPSLSDLKRQAQENLINFLRQEVNLAKTFCKIAETAHDAEHRKKLLHDVVTAVETIRRFKERIEEESVRAALQTEAERLDQFLAKCQDS